MKYFDTKKDSLEEAISKAINEKPEQLKEEVVAKDLLEAGGKYMKYSDLLLQKGRLLQQGKNTAMIDKEISKEMKKLNIKEASDEYEKFFKSALKKFKIDSPADLKTDDKKKEFFNYVDKNYKAKEEDLDKEDEKSVKDVVKGLKKAVKTHQGQVKSLTKDISDEVDLEEKNLQEGMNADTAKAILKMRSKDKFEIFRGDYVPMIYLSKLDRKTLKDAGHKMTQDIPQPTLGQTVTGILNVANGSTKNLNRAGMYDTETDDMKGKNPAVINMKKYNTRKGDFEKVGYPKTVGDLVKMTGLRLNSNDPSKNNVDETLDKIREANIQKGRTMRSILADIWKMNEGKSPFEKDEGFASDAQRKAAFASGYKEKGKKGKKEEDEKSSKTATGQKPTKVEIEPEVK